MDNIATLEDIKRELSNVQMRIRLQRKRKFVEQLNYVCREMEQPVKCMFYKLVESKMLPDVDLSLISEVKGNKYIKQGIPKTF